MPLRPLKRFLNSGRAPSVNGGMPLRSATELRLFLVANSLVVAIASVSWNGVGSLTACPRCSYRLLTWLAVSSGLLDRVSFLKTTDWDTPVYSGYASICLEVSAL